jgi:hypothetical protein
MGFTMSLAVVAIICNTAIGVVAMLIARRHRH